jgi:hypothetical protein
MANETLATEERAARKARNLARYTRHYQRHRPVPVHVCRMPGPPQPLAERYTLKQLQEIFLEKHWSGAIKTVPKEKKPKFTPHQGTAEKLRRQRQMRKFGEQHG